MTKQTALVDIVIPCLNAALTAPSALASCVNQPFVNNVIIGDNCSDDQLEKVVKDFNSPKVIYIRFNKRVSMLENWLRTAKYSASNYVKILPADDTLFPHAIQSEIDLLNSSEKNIALTSSPRLILHPSSIVQTILDRTINKCHKTRSASILVRDFEEWQSRQACNMLGEPSCILFTGAILRRLASSKELLDDVLSEQSLYPYVTDLVLYRHYLKLVPPDSFVVFTSNPGSTFAISRNTGTWRMRHRQSTDLIHFFGSMGYKMTARLRLKIYLRSAIRNALLHAS